MLHRLALVLLVLLPVSVAHADTDALYRALALGDVLKIMVEEGRQHGERLEEEMFPGRGGQSWKRRVDEIYEFGRMSAEVRRTFARALEGVDVAPLVAFFDSPLGRRIVSLEISAREALLDGDVEDALTERVRSMRRQQDPRLDLIEAFAEANDLVESNVAGALTSNYAFFRGLAEGGAFEDRPSDDEVLVDVWDQEDDVRDETRDWVLVYLTLAFQPLEDAEVEAYIALSRTTEGRALNHALFAAFDPVFARISHDLGRGAARFIASEDI